MFQRPYLRYTLRLSRVIQCPNVNLNTHILISFRQAHSFQQLTTSQLQDSNQLGGIYDKIGPVQFIYEVGSSLRSPNGLNEKENNVFYEFVISKLNKFSQTRKSLPVASRKKIQYEQIEGLSKRENIIYFLFQLSLNLNMTKSAYDIISNYLKEMLFHIDRINPIMLDTLATHKNIKAIIEILSVDQSQKQNLEELNSIIYLLTTYNKLMKNLSRHDDIYELTDPQIKRIIDKAYNNLLPDITISMSPPFESIETVVHPHATIEKVIKELGLVISERVSEAISYYNPKAFEDENADGINEIKIPDMSVEELLDRQLLSKYLQFCYCVIRDRCKYNDPITIFAIWNTIKPFHTKLYNSIINSEVNHLSNDFYYYQTLAQMIRTFSKNERYRNLVTDIVYNLPLDSVKVCPELMSAILYHCARTKNKFLGRLVGSRYDEATSSKDNNNKMNIVFGQGGDLKILGTGEKFTPDQVHSFLAYNLRIGNMDRATEIINYLKYKMIGFKDIDFNELVRSVLYNADSGLNIDAKNIEASNIAWEMMKNNVKKGDIKLNKYALVTYLDFMLDDKSRELDFEKVDIIYSWVKKCARSKDVKYWNHFHMSYFKYITRMYPLEIAKTVYINSKKYSLQGKNSKNASALLYFEKLDDLGYSFNPFSKRYTDVRIKMNPELSTLVLRDIYQTSDGYLKRARALESDDLEEAEAQFKSISLWVMSELEELVGSKKSRNKNNRTFRKSIIVDLMRTINSKSRETGFQQLTPAETLDESELKYRLRKGEIVAIDNITLAEDYRQTLVDPKEQSTANNPE